MARRSKFQAPRVVSDFHAVQRALRDIQDALDEATGAKAELKLNTRNFALVAGNFHRCSAPVLGIQARLPRASGDNLAEPIILHLENMLGELVIFAAPGQTINGASTATFDTDGVVVLWSNGVDSWQGVAQLPAESPGGAALDAEYVLGAAHVSLPNGRVATDSAEVDAVLTTPNVISWALNTASVAFAKLANLTGLSVLGRAANSAGVMAAITATAANQYLRANAAGTALEWGNPASSSVLNNAGSFERAALTGAVTAGQNVNATLFGASASGAGLTGGGTAILAVGAGTHITVNTDDVAVNLTTLVPAIDSPSVVADGTVLERAALTGAIAAAQDSNATLFSGIQNNGAATTDRQSLNFIGFTIVDDAANDRINITAAGGLSDGDKGDITVSASGATWTVDADITKTWTGVHSFTGASHTIDVTGAVNIDADAASRFITSVGNLTLQTTQAASRVIVSGADDVLIEAVADDIFINSGGDTQFDTANQWRVRTAGVERLEIQAGGAWQLGGVAVGSFGQLITSNGAGTPPTWALPGVGASFDAVLAAGTTSNLAIGAVNCVRVSGPGGGAVMNLTGMVATTNGQWVFVENTSTTDTLVLMHDVTSTAANRFQCVSFQDIAIPIGGGVWCRYDSTVQRWFVAKNRLDGVTVELNNATPNAHCVILDFNEGAGITIGKSSAAVGSAGLEADLTFSVNQAATFTWTGTQLHQEKASSPAVGAGNGMFWVQNLAPSEPVFTDDLEADWRLNTSGVAASSAVTTVTAAVTTITPCTFTIPANTLRVGSCYELEIMGVFVRGATATALNLVVDLLINSASARNFATAMSTVAGSYAFNIRAMINMTAIGLGGTAACQICGNNAAGPSATNGNQGSTTTSLVSVDTTLGRPIALRINMSAAVAATSLTVSNALIRKAF